MKKDRSSWSIQTARSGGASSSVLAARKSSFPLAPIPMLALKDARGKRDDARKMLADGIRPRRDEEGSGGEQV